MHAERIICDTTGDEYADLKERVKESCNKLKEAISRVAHLTEKCKRTFDLPVKNNEELLEMFSAYNKYLYYLIDLHYHMIQIEYPIEQKKAYELACKISTHNQLIIEEKLKPSMKTLCKLLPKDKELKWSLNYIDILHHMSVSLKWLCRGLNHYKAEENNECYGAIKEAKNNGQNCYDYFEKYTDKNSTFYMAYVERWLDFVAKNYEFFKGIALNIDQMYIDQTYYSGGTFDSDNLMEKKGPIEPFKVEEFGDAFE